jgi:hypothetical protein
VPRPDLDRKLTPHDGRHERGQVGVVGHGHGPLLVDPPVQLHAQERIDVETALQVVAEEAGQEQVDPPPMRHVQTSA